MNPFQSWKSDSLEELVQLLAFPQAVHVGLAKPERAFGKDAPVNPFIEHLDAPRHVAIDWDARFGCEAVDGSGHVLGLWRCSRKGKRQFVFLLHGDDSPVSYPVYRSGGARLPGRVGTRDLIDQGQLWRVPDSPSFSLPAYMVFPVDHQEDVLVSALDSLRALGAEERAASRESLMTAITNK